jgi:hypothetical protein
LTEDAYRSYSALLETLDGAVVHEFTDLHSEPNTTGRSMIALKIPTASLAKGTFIVRLYGLQRGQRRIVDAYSVRVLR